jgi:SAM-dependent methyltransferase
MNAHRQESPQLRFTGERFVPGIPELEDLYYEHISRYLMAAPFCPQCDVLDVACGAGYGTYHLATHGARSVLGVDRSLDAVAFAQAQYGNRGLVFAVGDAEALPVPTSSLDVVVSFETIEHVPNPEAALAEISRVLRATGTLIISSPNRDVYRPGGAEERNPFHVREFTVTEFRALLERHFAQVRMFAQRSMQGVAIWEDGSPIDRYDRIVPLASMDSAGIQPKNAPFPSVNAATYQVAICRCEGARHPTPATWFFSYPTDVLKSTREWAVALQHENEELSARIAAVTPQQGNLQPPHPTRSPLDDGNAARARGAWETAALFYSDFLETNRGCAEARAGLGVCLIALGDRDEGLAQLHEAARLAPTPDIVNDLACGLMSADRLEDAEQLLEGILGMAPSHEEARANLTTLRAAHPTTGAPQTRGDAARWLARPSGKSSDSCG